MNRLGNIHLGDLLQSYQLLWWWLLLLWLLILLLWRVLKDFFLRRWLYLNSFFHWRGLIIYLALKPCILLPDFFLFSLLLLLFLSHLSLQLLWVGLLLPQLSLVLFLSDSWTCDLSDFIECPALGILLLQLLFNLNLRIKMSLVLFLLMPSSWLNLSRVFWPSLLRASRYVPKSDLCALFFKSHLLL